MTWLRKPLPLSTDLRNNTCIPNLTTHHPRGNNQINTPIFPLQSILDRPPELEPAIVDIICQVCWEPVLHEVLEGPGFENTQPEDVDFGDREDVVGEFGGAGETDVVEEIEKGAEGEEGEDEEDYGDDGHDIVVVVVV